MQSKEILLEQYKLYVEMADRISTRRNDSNKFYSSIILGTGLVTYFNSNNLETKSSLSIAIGMLLLGIIWVLNLRSYRQLNSAKFKIIHELEKKLEFACYDEEWKLLIQKKSGFRYFQLSKAEALLPYALILFSILLILISINPS